MTIAAYTTVRVAAGACIACVTSLATRIDVAHATERSNIVRYAMQCGQPLAQGAWLQHTGSREARGARSHAQLLVAGAGATCRRVMPRDVSAQSVRREAC